MEIVRCKDCKYSKTGMVYGYNGDDIPDEYLIYCKGAPEKTKWHDVMGINDHHGTLYGGGMNGIVDPNDYCSYGELKS